MIEVNQTKVIMIKLVKVSKESLQVVEWYLRSLLQFSVNFRHFRHFVNSQGFSLKQDSEFQKRQNRVKNWLVDSFGIEKHVMNSSCPFTIFCTKFWRFTVSHRKFCSTGAFFTKVTAWKKGIIPQLFSFALTTPLLFCSHFERKTLSFSRATSIWYENSLLYDVPITPCQ